MAAGIFFNVGLPFAVAEDIPVQVDVYLNRRIVGQCVSFLSEQKGEKPPGVPRQFDGDVIISGDTRSAMLQIMCTDQQNMQKVISILQVLAGIREQ